MALHSRRIEVAVIHNLLILFNKLSPVSRETSKPVQR
jgi:hypothetical protein